MNRNFLSRIDWLLISSAVAVVAIGMVTMTSFGGPDTFFSKQMVALAFSLIVCFAVCAWILWHKIPYLKKLSPEVIEVSHERENATFWSEMYPEITSGVRKFDWPSKKQFLISETEKIVI